MADEATAPKARAAKAAKEPKALAAPDGCVYLRHPEGGSCSFRGVELAADSDGNILAPLHAAEDLAAHGFLPIDGE